MGMSSVPVAWVKVGNPLEMTGLEFASEADLTRQMESDSFWLKRGDHPTVSSETLRWRTQQVRRERLRRLDPQEANWHH